MSNWILKTDSDFVTKNLNPIDGSVTIGRGAGSGIVIRKDEISRNHAEVIDRNGQLFVGDMGSSNGTFVNGNKIEKEVQLKDGDVIGIDVVNFTVMYVDMSAANKSSPSSEIGKTATYASVDHTLIRAAVESPSMTLMQKGINVSNTRLTIMRGNNIGKSFSIGDIGVIKIGRSNKCDIVLDDPAVSGEHLQIEETPEGWEIINLSQTNGLFVNGQKTLRQTLQTNDVIEVGSTGLRFESDHTQNASNNKIPDWMRNQH